MPSINGRSDPDVPTKQTPIRVARAASAIGSHLADWRRMQNLTAVQVAERADISRDTLRRLEHGDPGVSLGTVLGVARALGALDRVIEALDPVSYTHLTLPTNREV